MPREDRSRPVRPRDAASLVLVRDGAVLMGRRARRHRFLPDMYVFPGGRLDAADWRVRPRSPLRPEVERRLSEAATPARARALAVAAVRETWEEAGLVLGDLDGDTLAPDLAPLEALVRAITPPVSPIRFHARFFVADGALARGALRENGELLDLAWRPIDECLALPLADITEFVLGELRGWLATRRAPERLPLFRYLHGRANVRR